MPSTSETGHAKNVANLETLISFCNGYGATYNPSKEALSIAKLKQLQTEADDALLQTKKAKTNFDNATNARQEAFKGLKPLATKIINALAAAGANALTIDDAKGINRKIRGTKAAPKIKVAPQDAPPNKTISTSQQSYDSLIDHFTKLIQNVSQDSSYKPNEAELKTTALQQDLEKLKRLNTNVIDEFTNWSNARIKRDNILYNPLTGLVQTALDIKKYVKSVFGASSPQFKQVSSIEFTDAKGR